MVHNFEIDGKYYLFDSESGSLHICDALVNEVVKKANGEKYDFGGADEEAISEIERELAELKEKGLLFSEKKK